MKNAAHYATVVHRAVKFEEHLIRQIDGPVSHPQSRPLSQGCDYPLFQFNRVSQDVVRRRAIVRG